MTLPRLHEVYETKLSDARVMICVEIHRTDYGDRYTFFVLDDGPNPGSGSAFRTWVEGGYATSAFGLGNFRGFGEGFDMSAAYKNFSFTKIA